MHVRAHSATQPLALADLPARAASPYSTAGASPFESPPWLLIDARTPPPHCNEAECQRVAAWLRHQPCPVIALSGDDTHDAADPWRDDYDVRLASFEAAAPLLINIERAPLAAMTLVQVLRTTEHLSVAEGLLVESLAYATLQGGAEFRRWRAEHPAPPPHSADRDRDDGPAVQIERRAAQLDIRLNRPARRNAMSVDMRDALVEALQLVVADTSIETACLAGNGACFSVGGDLAEFGTTPDPASAHAIRSLRLPAPLAAQCAARLHARLHGACIGAGIELPAFAARVTAARKTFFQLPEIRFGLIPGAGGCISLPHRIGRQRTAWLALSARRIDTTTALAWGLVDALVD